MIFPFIIAPLDVLQAHADRADWSGGRHFSADFDGPALQLFHTLGVCILVGSAHTDAQIIACAAFTANLQNPITVLVLGNHDAAPAGEAETGQIDTEP